MEDSRASAPGEDLVATICHDLKEPLSSILMGATFLARHIPQGEPGAPARKMLDAIQRSAQRMNRVLGDYHDLARIEEGRLALDLADEEVRALLEHVVAALEPRVGAPLAITVSGEAGGEAAPPGPRVRCDRARVTQAFEKLLANAAQASRSPASTSIAIEARAERRAVRFVVRDRGAGIDPEVQPHLFDYRWLATRRARTRPGLGLGVARGIIEAHGGALRLDATGPEGTSISFTLPLASEPRA